MIINRNSERLEALIWDVGDVIVHFDQSKANNALAAACGKSPNEVNAVLFGGSSGTKEYNKGLREKYALGLQDSREFFEAVQRELGLNMTYGQFADAWCEMFEPHVEIVDFVQRARRRGIPQCVLSSTDPLHMEKMASVGKLRESIGKENFVTTYHVGKKKPHPDLFDAAVRVLEVPKERCVYVEDVKKYADAFDVYGGGAAVLLDPKQQGFQRRAIEDLQSLGFKA